MSIMMIMTLMEVQIVISDDFIRTKGFDLKYPVGD